MDSNGANDSSWTLRNWLVFAAIGIVYVTLCFSLRSDVFWSIDEGGKFLQLVGLRWDDGIAYDIPYPGENLDPKRRFYPRWAAYPQPLPDGGFHANWPATYPLLTRPFYDLFGTRGLHVLPLLGGLVAILLAGRLVPPRHAAAAMLLAAFTTSTCFYSLLFWEHTPALALVLVAVAWMTRGDARWTALPWAALPIAAAMALRWEALLAVPVLVLVPLLSARPSKLDRRGLITVLAIVVVLGALAALTLSPKIATFAGRSLERILDPEFWAKVPRRVARCWLGFETAAPGSLPTLTGLVGIALCILGPLFARTRSWLLLAGAALVAVASVSALFAPERYRLIHGLFLPCPLLVFAFANLSRRDPKRSATAVRLDGMALFYGGIGTVAIVFGVHGGLEWGPRYILPAQVLLAVSALGGYLRLRDGTYGAERTAIRLVFLVLVLLSFGFQVRGFGEIFRAKMDVVQYRRHMKFSEVVVTDRKWLPAVIGSDVLTRPIYVLDQPSEWAPWLRRASGRVGNFLLVVSEDAPDDHAERAARAGYSVTLQRSEEKMGLRFQLYSFTP